MIRSTIQPGRSTCFVWSYLIGNRLQVVWYKHWPGRKLQARWVSQFVAWLTVGKLEVRLHFP